MCLCLNWEFDLTVLNVHNNVQINVNLLWVEFLLNYWEQNNRHEWGLWSVDREKSPEGPKPPPGSFMSSSQCRRCAFVPGDT